MPNKERTRGFLQTVHNIQNYIAEQTLEPGEKLPSERELTETLSVSRSSVREGLRALELLGIIETRVGEGTFLKDSSEFQVVEMLGLFFLQSEDTLLDILGARTMIERQALAELLDKQYQHVQVEYSQNIHDVHEQVVGTIVATLPNQILQRIWRVLHHYFSHLSIAQPTDEVVRAYKNIVSNESEREHVIKNYDEVNQYYRNLCQQSVQ
ncbi:MAG: FadR/GntR family transcriptional regulator [Bacilli bacterium]